MSKTYCCIELEVFRIHIFGCQRCLPCLLICTQRPKSSHQCTLNVSRLEHWDRLILLSPNMQRLLRIACSM